MVLKSFKKFFNDSTQGGQPTLKFKFQEFSRSIPEVFMKFPGVAMG